MIVAAYMSGLLITNTILIYFILSNYDNDFVSWILLFLLIGIFVVSLVLLWDNGEMLKSLVGGLI